jgi:hypothetical protein
MNKELIELIDQPDSDRGKILMCLATKGPMKSFDVASCIGIDINRANAHLGDMFRDSAYIDIERYKVDGVWVYNLISLKCKMSESRKMKHQRPKMERKEADIPFDRWRKVFCLMDSCCG